LPAESSGQEQAGKAVQRQPQQGRPDRQCREQPRRRAQRHGPRPKPAEQGQQHAGNHQKEHVPDRNAPRKIGGVRVILQAIPKEFLENDEQQIEITTGKAAPDRQQE